MTPTGHGKKESTSDSWDKVPRANRGTMGRRTMMWNRGGRGKRVLDTRQLQERGVWPEAWGSDHQNWLLS
jgi:hypothetical protein